MNCAILTISDTRTAGTDTSGAIIRELLLAAKHAVLECEIVPDEPDRIRERVLRFCNDVAIQCLLLTGGTGISVRDITYEVLDPLLDKRLDGFGELFRMLSFQEIGPSAMLSRALAGTRGKTLIFSMPGSTPAVRLAMDRLILPTIQHAASLL